MKNVWGLALMGGIGWFIWETVTPAMWWEVGKWVGTGLLGIILLYVLIWNIKHRAEQREFERQEVMMHRQRKKERLTQAQPQIMYLPSANSFQPTAFSQQPAGLMDLPIEKYEWEV